MDVKLERYKIFCTVAECGSFSAAAEKLFITQSAVSQSIRSLEDSLGAPLFIRRKNGVELTKMGSLLYEYAGKALSLLHAAERRFAEAAALSDGELSIGAGDTMCRHLLLPSLERFHTLYPAVRLMIANRVTSEAVNDLRSGKTEIAFLNLPYPPAQEDGAIKIRKSLKLHDVFAVSPEYRLPLDRVFSWNEIAALPLVMLERQSNSRCRVEEFMLSRGVRLEPEFELGSHDLVLAFAAARLGIACVTKEFAEGDLAGGRLCVLRTAEDLPARNIGIATSANIPLSPAARAFLRIFEEEMEIKEKNRGVQ